MRRWSLARAAVARGAEAGGGEMQITCLGHAGLHIQTSGGTILCDPWKNPAYFGSWSVFPDNSGLDWDRYGQVDFLYVSHLHRDHFDPALLSKHVSRQATVLLPDFPVDDLRDELEQLGFTRFIVMPSGEVVQRGGLRLMTQALVSPADGPLGDSALAVDDGTASILNQNDARPADLRAARGRPAQLRRGETSKRPGPRAALRHGRRRPACGALRRAGVFPG
jgi:UDP-MurNAc hydroxylase